MRKDFIEAVRGNKEHFGLALPDETIERLADHYDLVQRENRLLHLVAPCSAEEFAVRHVLESLAMLKYLPKAARFADVGAGGGFPSIPCLIARSDLSAVLIESKEKKARYLNDAISELGLSGRAVIENRQFEEVADKNFSFVACRALDRFKDKLPRLLRWSRGRTRLFFGGDALGDALTNAKAKFDRHLLPMSEQRYLFVVRKEP